MVSGLVDVRVHEQLQTKLARASVVMVNSDLSLTFWTDTKMLCCNRILV